MATNARNRRLEPGYKQHAVVDDVRGVVLDVEVTTGEVNEGQVGSGYSSSSGSSLGPPAPIESPLRPINSGRAHSNHRFQQIRLHL
jgi:hypothetical protein